MRCCNPRVRTSCAERALNMRGDERDLVRARAFCRVSEWAIEWELMESSAVWFMRNICNTWHLYTKHGMQHGEVWNWDRSVLPGWSVLVDFSGVYMRTKRFIDQRIDLQKRGLVKLNCKPYWFWISFSATPTLASEE